MINIMFVCHGNICRSPMAEFVLKDMVEEIGLKGKFNIKSSATSTEEIGSPVHPGTRKILNQYGISCEGKRVVQFTKADYENFDYVIVMDSENVRNLKTMIQNADESKIYKLLEFAGESRDIADPWYTGDFQKTYEDIEKGCEGFLEEVLEIIKFFNH